MSEQLIATPATFGENGNFLLEREIGAGGMGGVYMGRDKMLDRPVAVKIMLREYGSDAEFVERFKKEAQAAAKLIHPNIVQVYSYGLCDGMPYIAMELASGGSLYSIMENAKGSTDVQRVLKIGQQVAQALQCASDIGFVHGDVKPENILLDANGNAKLVDFGLAAMQKDSDEIWGTPYYISPERVKKEAVDFRADMYSLGGTLYHALTGVPPFDGEDTIAVVKQRFAGLPKKPSEIRPDLTPAIDRLVMTMLALDKNARYPSFEALISAFKEVLTTGLTKKISAGEAREGAAAGAGRRMVVRNRRTVAMHRPGMTVKKSVSDVDDTSVADLPPVEKSEEEEDEGGGSIVLKVVLFALGGLLLIGGVVGGLFWFKASSEAAEKAEVLAQISGGVEKAKNAISDTVSKAKKFADEFDAFAQKAIDACEKPTEELKKILPPDQGAALKPLVSKAVVAAVAPVASAAKAVATNAPAAKAVATTNAPAAKAATTNAPAAKAAEAPAAEMPQVVITMNELWERAYACQASAVRIREAVQQIVKKAAEGDALSEVNKENMEKLAAISRAVVDMFEQLTHSKEVEDVKKGIALIKTKGEKTVEQTVKRLRIEKLEKERKNKAEAAAAAEKEKKEKAESEHKAKIAAEIKSIDEKFDAIVAQGSLRQLDWKGALRQLESVKGDFETAEGSLRADVHIRKVTSMRAMQTVFVKNLKGYAFKGKLKGATVSGVNEKEIQLSGAKVKRLTWQRFYKDYPGNLNELINNFIVQGRKNCKPALNLRDWADAMTGAALTLKIVCSEVNGAAARSEQLAKECVKQFPDFVETARGIFPEIKFEVEEE